MRFLLKSALLSFLKTKKWNFRDKKWRVALDATELQQSCHRNRQPTAPKHARLTKFCQVASNEAFQGSVPKFVNFYHAIDVPNKRCQTWPMWVLGADGKRACVRNSRRSSAKCGNGLRWESAGAGLATWRLTRSVASVGEVEIASWRTRNCRTAIQSKTQEPCKKKLLNIFHVEPWQQKNMFPTSHLTPQQRRTKSGHRANSQAAV